MTIFRDYPYDHYVIRVLFQEIYDEGTVLIREGEPGDTFFVISEGTVG